METLGCLLLWGETCQRVRKGWTCSVKMERGTWSLVCEKGEFATGAKYSPQKSRRHPWNGSLIESLCLLEARSAIVSGTVVEAGKLDATICFTITCTPGYLENGEWRQNKPIGRIFELLQPWDSPPQNMTKVPWAPEATTQPPPTISDLFEEMPTVDAALKEIQNTIQQSSWIELLPDDVLVQIFQKLDPQSFRVVQCCCRSLKMAATRAIPCLTTDLCKHQRDGLEWMMIRERPPASLPHPFIKSITSSTSKEYSLNTVSGTLARGSTPLVQDCRGGVLADEPGLGKTVTILSLVMRTKGMLPESPPNIDACFNQDGQGNIVGYYTIPKSYLAAESSIEKSCLGTPMSSPCKRRLRSASSELSEMANGVSTPVSIRKKLRSTRSSTGSSMFSYMREIGLATPGSRSSYGSLTETLESCEEDEVIKEAMTWVQCDSCQKWRLLPEAIEVDENAAWYCALHPDSQRNSCEIDQEILDTSELSHASGFVPIGTPGGVESNIKFFRQVLERFDALLAQAGDKHNALALLVSRNPKEISTGFYVQQGYQQPKQYGVVFQALGLESVPSKGRTRKTAKPRQSHRWISPKTHHLLHFDTKALSSALAESAAHEAELRVYLSRATLVVLPPTLIEQWKGQISDHFDGDLLRVRIITSHTHYPANIHELAWNYDLVLTTFSHFSSEWTRGEASFLQIHWLRVILDEGHIIGTQPLNESNRNQMLRALRAERRWVMTGTPTPNTPSSNTGHLYPLLAFLRHQPYGGSRRDWEEYVQKPFEAGFSKGRERLTSVLWHIFIRSSKKQLRTLPPMKRKVIMLDFEPTHAQSFNELVEVIQRNILLADWGEASHNESLLNPRNSKWGRQMTENLRLSCCIAGNTNLQVNEEDLKETIQLLSDRKGVRCDFNPFPPYLPYGHPFTGIAQSMRNGGTCQKCNADIRMPVLTPCAHLLCTGCLGEVRFSCPMKGCHTDFEIQSEKDPHRLLHNATPGHPVPIEVIEWQPSYAQRGAIGISGGEWNPNWEATQSSKCAYLVNRLHEIGAVKDRAGNLSPKTKAIVFSQFWRHHKLIERTLLESGIKFSILWKSLDPKKKDDNIHRFRNYQDTGILLMDESGAVGLDLSMANWVFLMEPLADRSLEEQIVSRAHRMGALDPINVEVVVMRDSAEEHLMKLCKEGVSGTKQANEGTGQSGEVGRKLRYMLLTNLKRAGKA